jgi:hypothetical protein
LHRACRQHDLAARHDGLVATAGQFDSDGAVIPEENANDGPVGEKGHAA